MKNLPVIILVFMTTIAFNSLQAQDQKSISKAQKSDAPIIQNEETEIKKIETPKDPKPKHSDAKRNEKSKEKLENTQRNHSQKNNKDKREHAEDRSKGNAYSGKGKGGEKNLKESEKTKPNQKSSTKPKENY